MGFRSRGYDKEALPEKERDYKLFAIAGEGTEREPEYFRPFNGINRIKVDIIDEKGGRDKGSAPKKVLERAKKYIDKVGLSEEDGDTLWFVVDVDRWPRKQLEELNDYCQTYPNWHIAISNPCFEIWLLFHKCKDLDSIDCSEPDKAKRALHDLQKGGYHYRDYLPLLEEAVKNAKAKDTNPRHYLANPKESKVYLLGEALLEHIGKPRFNQFVSELKPAKEG